MPRRLASIQVAVAANQSAKDFCNNKPAFVNVRSVAIRRRPAVRIAQVFSAPIFYLAPLFAAAFLLLSPSAGRAAGTADDWTGGASGSWTAATSTWSAGAIPTSAYDAIFNASGTNNATEAVTFGGTGTADGLIYNNTGTTLLEGSTAAETLTLEGDGIVVNSGAGAVTLGSTIAANALNLSLGAAQSWMNSSGSTLTVYNGVSLASAGSTTLTLDSTSTGSINISGVVGNGAGTLAMSVTGGTIVLSGANTFTGGLTVNAGTVKYTADSNLGTVTDGVTLTNGGTIDQTSTTAAFTTDHTYAITGSGTFDFAGTGNGTGSKITFANTASSQITGTGTLTTTGGADMYITGSVSSFSGAWNINGGYVEDATSNFATSAITVNSGGQFIDNGRTVGNKFTLAAGGILSSDNSSTTANSFTGTIALSGTGAAFVIPSDFYQTAAGTTIHATNVISGPSTASLTLTDTQPVGGYTSSSNGTFNPSGANTYSGGTTITSGTLLVGVSSVTTGGGTGLGITNGATGTGLVTVNGGILDVSTFNLAVGGLSGTGGTIASSSTGTLGSLTIDVPLSTTTDTYSGTIVNSTGSGTKTVSLTMGGSGTEVLSGVNTFTGATTVTGGILKIGATGVLGSGTGGGTAVTVNGGEFYNDSAVATIGGLTGISALNITAGSALLAGLSNYSGGTTLTAGTLAIGISSTTTGSGAALAISGTPTGTGLVTVNGGTLDLSTFNLALAGLAGSGGTVASSSTGTAGSLTILAGSTTQTYSGTIADTTGAGSQTVSVAINGAGTQVFAGANIYSGGTTVNSGTLRGTQVSGTPFGIGNINLNGGTLSLAPGAAGTVVLSGANAAAGSQFDYGGSGTLSLSIGGAASIAYTVGNASATSAILFRAGTGTLIIASQDSPSSLSGLGNGLADQFLINSTAAGAIATLSNGIVNPSIVGQSADANKSGDFLTTYTSGSATGFSIATYDTNFAAGTPIATTVEDVTVVQSSLGSTSVFALNAGANISLAAGATLSIGSYAATATATQSPQAGLILDGGATISGGTAVALGSAEGLIYTSLAGGSIATPITGSGGITTFGPGALTFGAINSYTGATTLYSPTVTIGPTGALGASGGTAVTVSGGTFIDDSTVAATGGLTGTSSLTISNGSATLASQNTYSGGTTVTSGTLSVGVSSATIGGGPTLAITSGATGTGLLIVNGGTVDLSTFSLAAAGLSGAGGTIASSSTTTAGSLAILTGATTEIYAGKIANTTGSGSQTVAVAVDGTGTQVFSGTNTFSGGLTVNGATVQFTTEANLGSGLVTLNNGATLYQSNAASTYTEGLTYSIGAGGGTFNFNSNAIGTGGKISFFTAGRLEGFGTFTKTGAADIYISTAQTFTGGVFINGGFIEDQSTTALGPTTNTVTINNGQLVSNATNISYNLTLNSGSVLSADNASTTGNIFSGQIAVTGAATIIPSDFYNSAAGNPIHITGPISGTGSITVTLTEPASFGGSVGTGTTGVVTLTNINTFTGTTTVTSGTLDLSNSASLEGSTLTSGGTNLQFDSSVASDAFEVGGLSGSTNLALQNNSGSPAAIALTIGSTLDNSSNTYSGILSVAGGSLIKAGSGTLTLTGANTYAGLTIINGGMLQVGNGATGSLNYRTGTPLTFTGTGTINFEEAAASAQQMVSLTPGVGDDTVQFTYVGTSTTTTLTFSSLSTRAVGAAMNFVTSGGTNGSTNSIILTGVPAGFIDQGTFFDGGTSNATYAYMNAAGTYIRGINYGSDPNSTDTTTSVTVLPAGNYDAVSGAGAVTAQTTAAITTLQLTNANNFTLASGQTLTVNGILKSGGSAGGTISDGLGIEPTAGGELVIRTDQSTDTLAISTPILANGADVVAISGAGALTLSGANTYSGGTYLNAGMLFINNGGSPSASAIGTGTLFINGGMIDNSTGAALTISTNNAQTWNGSFAYGGAQSLNLGTGAVTIAGNGGMPTTIAITAGAASAGTTLTVGGNISLAGTTTANPATAADTLAITGPGNIMLAGIISNGGGTGASLGLTMNGTGVLTLSNANTFTGNITINSGTLDYTADNNLGANAATITLSGGTLSETSSANPASLFATNHNYVIGPNGGTINLAGAVPWTGSRLEFDTTDQLSGAGTITKTGGGDLWLLKAQGFTGAWIINGGFVEVEYGTTAASGLGSGTVTVNSGGELTNNNSTIVNNLILNTGAVLAVDGGTPTYTGAITVSGAVSMVPANFYNNAAGGSMTVSGPISGTGSITETLTNAGYAATSPGTLTLSGSNTYTGGTIVNAGTLTVGVGGTLGATTGTLQVNNLNTGAGTAVTLNLSTTAATTTGSLNGTIATPASGANSATINTGAGQTFTVNQTSLGAFAGVIAGSGNFSLGSLSTSALTVAGANTYTGNTTVNAGTLIMTNPANALGNGNLTVASGAAFDYEPSAAGPLNLGSGNLTLASGSTIGAAVGGTGNQSAITTSGNASVGTSLTVNIYGIPSVTPATGNYLLVSAVNAANSGLAGASSYTFNIYNATNFTISDEVESATAISTDIVAATTLAANEYWLGGFSGGNNVWAISDGSANSNWVTDPTLLTATSLTPGPGTTINFSATGATSQGSMVLGANMSIQGIVVNDTNPIGLSNDGNTLTIGAGGITVDSGAVAVTLSPSIVLSAPQTWTNNGGNTLAVGNSATSVSNGTNLLTIAGSGATTITNFNGGTGGLTVSNAGGNPTVTLGGIIALNGVQTWTNNSSSPLTASGAIVTNGSLLILAGTGNVALNGAISGTGGLTASGSGVVTLSGTNTFSGAATVMPTSTVVAGNTSALGFGAATLSGGTLRITAPAGGTTVAGFGGNGSSFGTSGTANGWTVTTSVVTTGAFPSSNLLQLTDNNSATGNESRAAFYTTPVSVSNGFTASFTYTPSGNKQADGVAFILQDDPRGASAIGGSGGSLGYGGATGIANSVAAELNIYSGATGGIGIPTTLATDDSIPANVSVSPVSLGSGDPINVSLIYNPTAMTLTEILTDTTANTTFSKVYSGANLPSILGSNTAYVGFSGADGGEYSTQQISNFSYSTTPLSATYINNVVLTGGAASTIDVAANGTNPTITMGTLAVGNGAGTQLNVTGSTVPANQAYGLALGATTLSGSVIFDVADNTNGGGNAIGTLTLGAVGQTGGTWGITTIGPGTLLLGSANTYTGSTSVTAGTLTIGATGSIVSTGVSVSSGATMNVTLGASIAATTNLTDNGAVNLNNPTSTIAGLNGTNGAATLNLNSTALTITGGGAFAGTIADGASPGSLVVGGGTLILTGANAYSGGTTINSGTLQLGDGATSNGSVAGNILDNAALVFANVAPQTYAGVASGSGSLTVSGQSTLTLAGLNSYLGSTNVTAGALSIGATGAIVSTGVTISSGAAMNVLGGGSIAVATNLTENGAVILYNPITAIATLNGTKTSAALTLNGTALTITGGGAFAGVIADGTSSGNLVVSGGTLILTGANTYSGGTTISGGTLQLGDGVVNNGSVAGDILDDAALVFANATTPQTYGGVISGSGTVTVNGLSTLTLTGSNSYAGNTNVTAGTLTIGATGAIGSTGVTIASGAAMNVLAGGSIAAATNLTDNGTVSLYNPSTTIATLNSTNTSAAVTLKGTALTITGGGAFPGVIADGTSSGSLVVGGGTLILTGANTYSGGTTISSGTLQLGDGVANNGSVAGDILNNAALVFANATTPQTYGGVISGSGTVTVTNLSTLTLTGSNSYTGNTNVTAGTLTIGATGAIGGTGVNIASGATMNVLAGGSIAAATNLTDNGAVNLNNPTHTIASLNGSGALNLNSTALTVTGGGTFSGLIADGASPGSLVVGGGILSLSNNNSYSGGTQINGGTLRVANAPTTSGTGSGAVSIGSGGTLAGTGTASTGFIAGGVTVSGGGTIAPSGSGISPGESSVGTLTVGALTLSGGSMLNYQISNTAAVDSITVAYSGTSTGTGILTMPSSGSATVSFYQAGSTTPYVFTSGNTVYQLMTFGSAIGGGPNIGSLSLNALDLPSGDQATFSTIGNALDLTIGSGSGSSLWASNSSTAIFDSTANWSPAQIPSGAGLTATFDDGMRTTNSTIYVTVGANDVVGSLVFNNSSAPAFSPSYTLTGGNLTLNNNGSGANVIASNGASPVLASSMTLTLAEPGNNPTTTFNIDGSSSLEVAATIGESPAGQQIILSGGGTLELDNGTNFYSGGTTVNEGTLNVTAEVAGTSTLGSGPLAINGSSSAVNVTAPALTVGSLSGTGGGTLNVGNSNGASILTVNQTTTSTFNGTLSLTGGLVLAGASGNTLTISGTPSIAAGSSITVNTGTLALTNNNTGSPAIVGGAATATVASNATLQLAGSANVLSSAVNITTQGSGTSGDGAVSVVGASTQTVGVISGTAGNGSVTTYSGNTTVGDGTNAANLTAMQILQNTLTINAGSTVTIAPSGSGIPGDEVAATSAAVSGVALAAGSSASDGDSNSDPFTAIQAAIASGSISDAKGQQLENRIAAIERLAATDPGLEVSLLEDRVLAALPATSVWSSSGTSPLVETGSGLLTVDGSALGSAIESTTAFAPAAEFGGSPAAVPEPSTLLLALLGGLGVALAARRRIGRENL